MIGVAVLERARALGNGVENLLLHQQGADRRIAAAEPLGDRHQVGADPLLLAGVQRAGAAHAAHHLVEDEQDAVAVADLAHALEIAGHRRDRAQGGADHGLGDEGDDVVAAELVDLGFELFGQALAIGLRRLVRAPVAIFVDRRHMVGLDQQRRELLALPFAAADRERAERDAVIALAPRDDISPLRLAALDEILARELERGLDRLRPAADEEDVADARRRMGDQVVGQLLRRLRREEARMRIGEPVELRMHGRQHVRMRVPEAGHRRAARGVDVFLAGAVADHDALGARGDRIGMADLAMEDMGHDCCS